MKDRVHIRGARVVLREKTIKDAWNEYLWRTDPELSQLDAALPLTMGYEEFLTLYKDQLRYPVAWAKPFSVDTLDGAYIGNCMYYDVDVVGKAAEIGIMIGNRSYWNGGLRLRRDGHPVGAHLHNYGSEPAVSAHAEVEQAGAPMLREVRISVGKAGAAQPEGVCVHGVDAGGVGNAAGR